ncbi:hypothetical protein Taro_004584, partial [Colocasia esculenta]|nr:hypothetical protein [Colocasia esculenta]
VPVGAASIIPPTYPVGTWAVAADVGRPRLRWWADKPRDPHSASEGASVVEKTTPLSAREAGLSSSPGAQVQVRPCCCLWWGGGWWGYPTNLPPPLPSFHITTRDPFSLSLTRNLSLFLSMTACAHDVCGYSVVSCCSSSSSICTSSLGSASPESRAPQRWVLDREEMDAVSRCAVNQPWRIMLKVPSTGFDRHAFTFKGMNNEFLGLQVAGPGNKVFHHWSFIGGSRPKLQPKSPRFTPYRKGFCPSASWMVGSQIASNAFTLGTVAVLPFYTLMVVAPNSELTKKSMESSLPYVVLGVAYAYLLYLSWSPDTMKLMFASKYWLPELPGIAKLFSNEMTLASAWLHLLVLDLFAARQIFFDGMKHKIETRHSVSLCLFFCPIGIVTHVITKLLTREATHQE